MSDRRLLRLAAGSARLLAGTVVAALFATAVVTAVALPWPTADREPLAVTATPAPADTVAVCAGPLLALGRDPVRADALSVAAEQDVIVGAPVEVPIPAPATLTSPVADAPGPVVVAAEPLERTRSDLAASGSAAVASADLTGFAASPCQTPLAQSWIVGGAATTGSNDLLLLGNPGAVPAAVELTVYGATGAQTPPGGASLVVAAGEQRVVPLAGLALGDESPVVRVTATGAPVQAALQSSITRGLVPGGVDQVAAVATAETTQVIPGVTVTQSPGAAGASDATSLLRLLAPDADATAEVSVIDETGASVSVQRVPLTGGVPAQVELGGLAVGSYSVRVDAASPVVAAVWQATGFGAGDDFAWIVAAPAIDAGALVAVPEGPEPTLWIFNPADAEATVAVESLFGGVGATLRIPPGEAAREPVSSGDVYRIDPGGSVVHAAVALSGDGALAAVPVWPGASAAGSVVVYP